jgi:predicted ATPase
MLHRDRRERRLAQDCAEALVALTRELELPHWSAFGAIVYGWTLAMQGQWEEALPQIQQSLVTLRTTGAEIGRPSFLILLTEVHAAAGQVEAGLSVLAEALEQIDRTGERYREAEIYLFMGELLLQQSMPDTTQAEACLQQALAIARQQQAKSYELRAATSLARLWQQQNRRQEAYDLLAPVYGWFTEGFDTAELFCLLFSIR